jgi:hypothetical protein
MKFFLKIGIPWALSMVLVFYLGGRFLGDSGGSTSTVASKGSGANNSSLKTDGSSRNSGPKNSASDKRNPSYRESPGSTARPISPSPPLPPNLRRIMKGRDIISRLGAYLDAVRAMDRANVREVVTAFEELPKGYGRHLEMKLLMRSWAAIDPEAALEYAKTSLDEKSERRFGISEVLAGWANNDPQGAVEWAKANNNNAKREDGDMLVGVIRGLAENNLETANELLKTLPEGGARWQASTFLAQEYAELGTQEAIRWAENFPTEDSRLRETILGQLGARLSRLDLPGTAEWVKEMKNDKATQRITDNLLAQWVSQDAPSASQWVSGLQDEEKRSYAMKQLTSRWSLVDPVSTGQWLNSHPPSPSMDPAIGEFVNKISARDPEGAIQWAETIQDQETKSRALQKALGAWDKIDPARAKSWRQANNQNP